MEKYDLLIIGAGPGGYVAALEATKRGMKVLVVDKKEAGGTCVNRGCIPTKALLHASTIYKDMKDCEKFGLYAKEIGFDLQKLYQYKEESVVEMRKAIEEEFSRLGVTFVQGTAQVQADKRVVVKMAHMQKRTVGSGLSDDGKNPADILDTVIYEADKILIASGAAPRKLGLPGEELSEVMTSEELLQAKDRCYDRDTVIYEADKILIASGAAPRKLGLPGEELSEVMTSEELLQAKDRCYDRLVVVGGGVIGLEIATVFQALGSEVTVIELGERLLPSMDIEFAEALEKILVGRGIHVYKKSLIERFEKEENGVSCHLMSEGKKQILSADAVLVSVGREPYTEELFAADLKIRMDHGKVLVNEFFMTNIPGIYAIGDVIGGVQLAHVASAQAKYVVERMNNLEPSVILSIVPSCLFVSMSIIPNCLYLNPEIATVGLTEEEAERKGIPVRCGRYRMDANGQTILSKEEVGFIKVLFAADSDVLLTEEEAERKGIPVRCGRYRMDANGQTILSKEEVGFIKVLFAADSDVLLGAQIMCQRATDMIGELATAIANGLTSRQLMYAMRAHPTFNEAVSKAVEDSRE